MASHMNSKERLQTAMQTERAMKTREELVNTCSLSLKAACSTLNRGILHLMYTIYACYPKIDLLR